MDGYETEIDRQSGGPFSNRAERKRIRRCAEHWVERQRYSEERGRRFKRYSAWIGLATPGAIFAIKIIETIFSK